MDLSVNLGYFLKPNNGGGRPGFTTDDKGHTLEESLKMVKEIGYKKIDFDGVGCKDIQQAAELIEGYGLTVNQSHAPCNFYSQIDYDVFAKHLMSSIEKCSKLGSKIFVVHGNQADRKRPYNPEEILEFNYRLYSPVVEFAANNGMKVAFENTISKENAPAYCSAPEELLALTDKFADTKAVGVCWDFGHGNVMFDPNSIKEMLKLKGRVISTHVHDNHFLSDMHAIPFIGNIDWDEAMQALKDIDYKGDFTFEFVYKSYPEALFMEAMRFAYKTGEYLLSL